MLFLRATVAALILLAVAACGPAAQKFRGIGGHRRRDLRRDDELPATQSSL